MPPRPPTEQERLEIEIQKFLNHKPRESGLEVAPLKIRHPIPQLPDDPARWSNERLSEHLRRKRMGRIVDDPKLDSARQQAAKTLSSIIGFISAPWTQLGHPWAPAAAGVHEPTLTRKMSASVAAFFGPMITINDHPQRADGFMLSGHRYQSLPNDALHEGLVTFLLNGQPILTFNITEYFLCCEWWRENQPHTTTHEKQFEQKLNKCIFAPNLHFACEWQQRAQVAVASGCVEYNDGHTVWGPLPFRHVGTSEPDVPNVDIAFIAALRVVHRFHIYV